MSKETDKIIKILDKAWDLQIEDTTLNFKDEFVVAPQVGAGVSLWAKWLRENYIHQYDVLWAMREVDGEKEWLAIRVHIPFDDFSFSQATERTTTSLPNTFYFNLQNSSDRYKLKLLESEFQTYLNNK